MGLCGGRPAFQPWTQLHLGKSATRSRGFLNAHHLDPYRFLDSHRSPLRDPEDDVVATAEDHVSPWIPWRSISLLWE